MAKEKAANDPDSTTAATGKRKQGGKQDGSVVKKETKPVASKPPSKRQLLNKNEPEQNQDFSDLRKAIDADDKNRIKEIICRNLSDKNKAKKLVDDYNARYNKELLEMLEGKLEEDLIEALAGMSYSSAQHDAWSLHQAMKGVGTKEVVLIETFATRTNAEIAAIRQGYKKLYRKLLEEDIRDETSGDFETLIVELSKGQRDETTTVNDDLAHQDAETLLEAGIKKWGTDEEKFIEIFTMRSFPQLRAMLPEYKKWAKYEIEDTIDSEMSGNLRDGLKSLVACIRDQDKFLANKLHGSLQSKSTVDTTRIILGMGENEIAEVEKAYNSTFKPKLAVEVENKCSDELKKVLLAKLKEPTKVCIGDLSTFKPKLAVEVENKCSDELKKVLLAKLKDKGTDEEPQKDVPEEETNTQEEPPNKSSQQEEKSHESATDQKTIEDKPIEQGSDPVKKPEEKPVEKREERNKEEQKKEDRPKLNVKKMEYHATLKPAENFVAKDDASQLKSAMRGFGSDEDAIMAILGARTRKQRHEIAATFQQEFDKNLVDELKSELSGKFEDAIVALMSSPELYDANSLHDAMSGLGTDESVLVEILCSRSFEEIKAIKVVYRQVHSKDLVEEIKDETSGDLQTTLISLAQGERDSSEQLNEDLAYEDAHKLLEAGENKWGTEESVFIKILTSRSLTQLRATFEAYKNVAKIDIMESVNDELTGDFHDVVEAIVRCTRNPPLFFAEVLEKELGGFTADSKAVTRVLVTRAEIDLAEIKAEYEKKTGEALKVAIENRLKGDLEKLLLQIVGD